MVNVKKSLYKYIYQLIVFVRTNYVIKQMNLDNKELEFFLDVTSTIDIRIVFHFNIITPSKTAV